MFKWLNEVLREKVMAWLTAADSVLDHFFSFFKEIEVQTFNETPFEQQEWESKKQYRARMGIEKTLCRLEAHARGEKRSPKPTNLKVDDTLFKALRRSQKAHFLLSIGTEVSPDREAPPYFSEIKRRVCDIEFKAFDEKAFEREDAMARGENVSVEVPENTPTKMVPRRLAFFATSPDIKCGDYCIGSWNREETKNLILSNNASKESNIEVLVCLISLLCDNIKLTVSRDNSIRTVHNLTENIRDFFDPNHEDDNLINALTSKENKFESIQTHVIKPYLDNKPETLKAFLETFFTDTVWLSNKLIWLLCTLKGIPASEIWGNIFDEERSGENYEVGPGNSNDYNAVLNQQRCVYFMLRQDRTSKAHFTRLVDVKDHKGLIEAKILENRLGLSQTQQTYDEYTEKWCSLPPVRM